MMIHKELPFPFGKAICYSGYRVGQQPGTKYPTYDQIKEDLLILKGNWQYLRMYDCDPHAETVLEVIKQEKLNFRVFLGAYIVAEMNNFGCPWGGGTYSEEQLEKNAEINAAKIDRLIELGNQYPEIICALSVGNEACVDWTDHYVPVSRVIEFVKKVKSNAAQPVTFCENYVPWLNKLKPLAEVVDFISIHTYPVWEYKNIHEALGYTAENYQAVKSIYPDMHVVITEAGWATNSNGRGIDPKNVSEEFQKTYVTDLLEWSEKEHIIIFVFEAFDEPWKGSSEPLEPEKHWGLYKVERTAKLVVKEMAFNNDLNC